MSQRARIGLAKRVGVSVLALSGAAAFASAGTFASFTSSTSASQDVASGTVVIGLAADGPANRLSVDATGVAPGDTIQRIVDLSNTGSLDLASVVLTTSANPSSLLDTDTANGLQLAIDRCSVPWTEGGTAPAHTYTCSGTASGVLASRPVIGADLALAGLSSLTAGQTDHLRVILTLPGTAGNTLQNQASTISHAFTATQRTAAAR